MARRTTTGSKSGGTRKKLPVDTAKADAPQQAGTAATAAPDQAAKPPADSGATPAGAAAKSAKPETAKPATPERAKASTAKPAAPKAPAAVKTAAAKPAEAVTKTEAPEAAKPDAAKPDAAKPAADKPESTPAKPSEPTAPAPTDGGAKSVTNPPAADKGADADKTVSKPVPAAPPPAAPVAPARSSLLPLVFGGVLAGGIGFGANHLLNTSDAPDIAALQGQIADLRAELAARPDMPVAEVPSFDASALETEIAQLRSAFDTLEAQIAQVAEGGDTGLADQLASLSATLDTVAGRAAQASADSDAARADVADALTRFTALEAEMQDLRDLAENRVAMAEAAVDRALAQSGLDSIRAALETGAPFHDALARLQQAGINAPDAIADAAGGVATIEALQDSFADAARAALRDTLQSAPAQSLGDKLGNFLKAQTGARLTVAREGDDLDATLSRAGAAVEAGDIASALAEIDTTPESARAAMAAWTQRAQMRLAAFAALPELTSAVSKE